MSQVNSLEKSYKQNWRRLDLGRKRKAGKGSVLTWATKKASCSSLESEGLFVGFGVLEKKLKLRHNLDVMHIDKNICDNLVGTILNIEGKTKGHN